jgi:cell division septation protein DedD
MTTDIERGGIDAGSAHEPSYYEIALTNRQVVVAFVILLTCVVAAFLAGVWIGRESAARAQQRLALLAGGGPGSGGGEATPGGGGARGGNAGGGNDQKAEKAEKPDGQALQEFKFFADPRNRPGTDVDANGANGAKGAKGAKGSKGKQDANGESSGAAASSTLAEDLGSRTGAGNPASPPISAIPPVTSRRAPGAAGRTAAQAGGPAVAAPLAPGGAAGAKSSAGQAGTTAARSGAGSSGTAGSTNSNRSSRGTAARSTAAGAPGRSTPPEDGAAAPSGGESGEAAGAAGGARADAGEGEPLAATKARSAAAGGKAGTGASGASGKPNISWSPAGVAGASELVIQVFSTADKEQADKVRDGLVEAGFTAFLSPIAKAGGQTMYRVRIGPFASRAAAEAVAEKVRKEQKLDTWITPR